jgi:chromosome segregation ATPase
MHPVTSSLCTVQEDCADKQVYIRRLEAKLEELQGAADAAGKYQAAKQKVRSHRDVAVMSQLAIMHFAAGTSHWARTRPTWPSVSSS